MTDIDVNINSTYTFQFRPFQPPRINLAGKGRFGHTSKIALVLSDDSEQQSDYITGLLILSGIVGGILLLWAFLIVCCKLAGQKRVGYLSGQPFVCIVEEEETNDLLLVDEQEQADDETFEPTKREANKQPNNRTTTTKTTPNRVRIAFIGSGLIVVTFAILCVTQGLNVLNSTLQSVNVASVQVATVANSLATVIKYDIRGVRSTAIAAKNTFDGDLNGTICPNWNLSLPLPNAAQIIQSAIDDVRPQLANLGDVIRSSLNDLERAAVDLEKSANDAKNKTVDSLISWQTFAAILVYSVVTMTLVVSAIMAAYDVSFPKLHCLIAWFIFPIFCLLVALCCIVAPIMIAVAGANGDFCLPGGYPNSPSTTISQMLPFLGYPVGSFDYKVVMFYVNQCQTGQDPFQDVRQYLPIVRKINDAVGALGDKLQNSTLIDNIRLSCGRDLSKVLAITQSMRAILNTIKDSIVAILVLLSCDSLVPIFLVVAYEGVCTYSVSGVMWFFFATLIMGFFGLIMITFRSAYQVNNYVRQANVMPGDTMVQEVDPAIHGEAPTETIEDYGLDEKPAMAPQR